MAATVVLERASRARWLARRRKGITATDAPAIMGLSPWATPLSVWLEKVSPEPREPSYPMRRGLAMENLLADEYERQTGAFVTRPPMLVAHPDHPLLLASLDRDAHTPTHTYPLELKTGSDWADWADNDLPDVYAVQAQMQAAITGSEFTVVFADVAGRLETRVIPRDEQWEREAIPMLLQWWADYVVTRTPPPLHEWRDYPLLSRVWRTEPGEEIEADDAVMGAVKARQALQERAKHLENIDAGLKTQIRAYMGTAAVLTHPETGYKVASVTKSGALTFARSKPTPTEETA